jgi:hypothetical protein
MMGHSTTAVLLLALTGLSSCAAPSSETTETEGVDAGLHEVNVREWVEAMELGMARARLDLARREIRRSMRNPG